MTNSTPNDAQAKMKAKQALTLNKVQPNAHPKQPNKKVTGKTTKS